MHAYSGDVVYTDLEGSSTRDELVGELGLVGVADLQHGQLSARRPSGEATRLWTYRVVLVVSLSLVGVAAEPGRHVVQIREGELLGVDSSRWVVS